MSKNGKSYCQINQPSPGHEMDAIKAGDGLDLHTIMRCWLMTWCLFYSPSGVYSSDEGSEDKDDLFTAEELLTVEGLINQV